MIFTKKYFLLLFLFLAGILFASVHLFFGKKNTEEEREVKDANDLRKKYGVPIIETNWIRKSIAPGREKWSDGIRGINSSVAIHLYKEITYNDKRIELERDAFHFELSDSLQYRLVLYNQYSQDHSIPKRSKNELIIYEPERFPPSRSVSLSIEAADSVLRAWKII